MLNYMYQEYDVSSKQCIIILYGALIIHYYTLQETASMETILHETYPAPRMVLISSMARVQYFVTAENEVLGEYPSLQDTLFFFMFASCVSPEVSNSSKKHLTRFIVCHPDPHDRSGTYLATTSDIKRNL